MSCAGQQDAAGSFSATSPYLGVHCDTANSTADSCEHCSWQARSGVLCIGALEQSWLSAFGGHGLCKGWVACCCRLLPLASCIVYSIWLHGGFSIFQQLPGCRCGCNDPHIAFMMGCEKTCPRNKGAKMVSKSVEHARSLC